MPYRSSEISDRALLTDQMGELFKISMEMHAHAMETRQRAIGREIDAGSGFRGVVTAVDNKAVHLRAQDGTRRSVPLTGKCLTQVLHTPSGRPSPSAPSQGRGVVPPPPTTTRK